MHWAVLTQAEAEREREKKKILIVMNGSGVVQKAPG